MSCCRTLCPPHFPCRLPRRHRHSLPYLVHLRCLSYLGNLLNPGCRVPLVLTRLHYQPFFPRHLLWKRLTALLTALLHLFHLSSTLSARTQTLATARQYDPTHRHHHIASEAKKASFDITAPVHPSTSVPTPVTPKPSGSLRHIPLFTTHPHHGDKFKIGLLHPVTH